MLEQNLLLPSRVLAPHARFYVREMRILAYAQLLESYRSLTLESLAQAFGVSVEFVDRLVPALFRFATEMLTFFSTVNSRVSFRLDVYTPQ